jgi:hypothetical protein
MYHLEQFDSINDRFGFASAWWLSINVVEMSGNGIK